MSFSYNTLRLSLINKIKQIKWNCGINQYCTFSENASQIAQYLHLSIKTGSLPGDSLAFYDGISKTIVIDLRKGNSERINFTFYHEVSHHLIQTDDVIYSQMIDLVGENNNLDEIEEKLANAGAAEFLMPSDEIKKIIDNKGFSINLFPEIYEKYPASRQSVLVQMAQCSSHQCILCLCSPTMDENLRNRLMVEFSTRSPSTKYLIGKNHLIPLDHFLNNVSKSNRFLTDRKAQVPYKKSGIIHKVSSEGLFYDGKVYALFNLTEVPSSKSDIPTLF